MHGARDGQSKVTKKELLSIDIGQACNDLKNYVPTGRLDKSELQTKMSLYLLAQLSYGVTLVLNVQAEYLIVDLQSLLNTMVYAPVEKPQRKRRATEAAIAGMEQEDFEDGPIETPRTRKKRRTTQGTRPSLLDLADPRSYVDQQVPLPPRDRRETNELQELDEGFMDTTAGETLPPFDLAALLDEQTRGNQQKISVASLQDREESFREVERALGIEPIEIERADESISNGHMEQQHSEGISHLDATEDHVPVYRLELPDLDIQSVRAPPRHRRQLGLLIDYQTQLTDEQIQEQFHDYRGVIRSNQEFEDEFNREIQQPLSQLLKPLRSFLELNFFFKHLLVDYLGDEFRPLFERVEQYTKNYRERPLTFQEAQHLTFEQLQQRRFDIEIPSFQHSEKVSVAPLVLQPEESLEESSNERRPSTPLNIEVTRRGLRETMNEIIPLEESMQQIQLDESNQQILGDDTPLHFESILTKTSPDLPEEDWLDGEMSQLYNIIVEELEKENFVYFHVAAKVNELGKGEVGRKRAARKFFTLLKLLKHRKVKVLQDVPYGEILIRLVKQQGDLDVSTASM
uniref:Rad21_Rec8 domain-containing protein n=1 Tax=Meloidogyne hapla TaxID=6305 RepID=A0A1I8BYV7_MELHA